jgi:hypothetical protein
MLSIASAPGWKARIADDDAPDGVRVITLISWALVEEDAGETEIVGIVQRSGAPGLGTQLGFADEVDGFGGYTFTGVGVRQQD